MWLLAAVAAAVALVRGTEAGWAPAACGPANLTTRWTYKVDPAHVLPEYPRWASTRARDRGRRRRRRRRRDEVSPGNPLRKLGDPRNHHSS